MIPSRYHAVLAFTFILLIAGFGLALMWGPVAIPLSQTVTILFNQMPFAGSSSPDPATAIIIQLRLPRALTALMVGMALAVSGTVMQGLFRNPLATPYILGVASGGSAGAALTVVLGANSPYILPIGALLGSTLAIVMVYRMSWQTEGTSTYTLILAGVAISALFSAVTTLLIFLAGPYEQDQILFWIMGGLWRASWPLLYILTPIVLSGSIFVSFWSRDLNALALGESTATHLGVKPEVVKKVLLAAATIITSTSVAVAGAIGFVGLIVPHILRLIVGPDHRKLVITSGLAGGVFLMYTDVLAKTIAQPVELPVGIITAFLGAPFFLYLLNRKSSLGGMK